jgi:hypothetical protein
MIDDLRVLARNHTLVLSYHSSDAYADARSHLNLLSIIAFSICSKNSNRRNRSYILPPRLPQGSPGLGSNMHRTRSATGSCRKSRVLYVHGNCFSSLKRRLPSFAKRVDILFAASIQSSGSATFSREKVRRFVKQNTLKHLRARIRGTSPGYRIKG